MFGAAVVFYLFLGGLCGGLCLVAAVSGLSVPAEQLRVGPLPEQRRLMTASFTTCAGGLVLSALFLLADAGNVSALKYLFLSSNPNPLVIGAWSLAVGIVLSLALAILWRAPAAGWSVGLVRVLLILECVVGGVITVYTGLFLASIFAVPLWDTPWLIVLFVASSLSCALTAFMALANACGLSYTFEAWIRLLVRFDILMIVAEAVCALGLVLSALFFDPASSAASAAHDSVMQLLVGDFAIAWWLGFVVMGIVVPLVINVMLMRHRSSLAFHSLKALALAICVFAAGVSLRYAVVMAGMHPALGF